MNEHPPIEERDPRDFLATRSVGDFDHAVNVYPDPPTLSTGLTLPDRLDYMQVQSLEVSRGLPPGIETRNFNFGLRDFLITIDLDPVEGSNDKRYTANIRVYGMNDTDLETALRYYEARIDYAWGGVLAITMTRLPFVRRLSPRVLVSAGYSGQGVALAPLFGKILAEAVDGQLARFDLLGRLPVPPFPGGTLLRTPLMMAGLSYYALRDRL